MAKNAIETAITPVILIPANSLFLLTLTNRYSNITNRLRQLTVVHQLDTLYKRVLLVRGAIIIATSSLFLQVLLVLLLLYSSALNVSETTAVTIFGTSLVFMLASTAAFILDMIWSVNAVEEHVIAVRSLHGRGHNNTNEP